MTPDQVKKKYGSLYRFSKETKMSCCSLSNWLKWGYVPIMSQKKLEKITNGELKSSWDDVPL